MFRPLMLSVAAVALAAGVKAAPPPSGPGAGPPRAAAFISPAGEPFRAGPDGPAPMQAWFDGADADHNGGISRAEFAADHMRFFRLLDTNGDGFIAGPETTRYEEQIAPELLSALDRGLEARPGGGQRGGPPGGGRRGGGGPRFSLQGDDIIRLPQPAGQERQGGARRGGPPGGSPQRAPAFTSLLGEPEPVRAADTDLDFRVSIPEWNAMANQRFGRLDANHDGVVLFAELAPQNSAGQGGPGAGRGGRRPGGR